MTPPLAPPSQAGPTVLDARHAPDHDELHRRAKDYLRQVLDVAMGPSGLLISHVWFDTRKPVQAGEPDPAFFKQVIDSVWGPDTPRPTVSDWLYGENTLWATGFLLWSQLIRYRVSGEQEALDVARKCFRDIAHVFEMSRSLEPGVLGKPHGGRPGVTMSFDQSGNPIVFYLWFAQEHGDDAEQAQARRDLQEFGDWILGNDWVVNQHGRRKRIVDPAHTSSMKFFAAVHAAYQMTGQERFRDASLTELRKIIAQGMLPWPAPQYELNTNLVYYSLLAEFWHNTTAVHDADWIGMIGEYWRAAQAGLDDEGLLLDGVYDTTTGRFTPVTRHWSAEAPPSAGGPTPQRWWRSPTGYSGRTLYTLAVAIVAMMARKRGFDDEAHHVAEKILLRIDSDGLRQFWDDGAVPAELDHALNLFAPELPALWLVAYWMGREQKVW